MTSLLIHPSVMTAPQQVHSAEEAGRAIASVLDWGRVYQSGDYPLFLSEYSQLTLLDSPLLWNMEHLRRLYRDYRDGAWSPGLVLQAVQRLLFVAAAEDCLADGESIEQHDGLQISPPYVEDELLPDLASAAKHDAALLLREKGRRREGFDWAVAVSCRTRQEKRFDVSVQGPVSVRTAALQESIFLDGSLVYVTDPEHVVAVSDEDRLFDLVRQAVAGKRALLMGGDGRNFNEARFCQQLGLESIKFLEHYDKGHGQNIRTAQNILRKGKIAFFFVVVKFASHSVSLLKDKCPPDTRFVLIHGSPTARSIALALSQELKLDVA